MADLSRVAESLKGDFNKGMNDLLTSFNRGRDESAQALKAFPDSIGHSNYQSFYQEKAEEAQKAMEPKEIER